jgi:hypothetical protein
MKIVCAIPFPPSPKLGRREYKESARETEEKSHAVFVTEFDGKITRVFSRSCDFSGYFCRYCEVQAAFSSGRSTNSHSDNPLHFRHLGKLASLVSITSSPQQSDTYKPDSFTS